MLILSSTSDIIRVVTGAAADIECHASWVDNASGTITPGRTNTASIVTATTTTIVAAPGASTQRNIKHLNITNNHASTSCQVEIEHFDGTNSVELMGCTLLAGESLVFTEAGDWMHHDVNGADYGYTLNAPGNLGLTGTLAESIPRNLCPEVNTTVAVSGRLFMQSIYLTAGQTISNVILWSATTAAVTPTNYNVGLYNSALSLLAQGTNKTTEAWAANSQKTFALTSSYRVPASGLYYVGYYMAAATVVTMKGGTAKTGGQLAAGVPILHGISTTGLTTALPNPAAAITAGTANIYVAVT